MSSLLNNKYLRIVTLLLIAQAVLFYTANGSERTPLAAPLAAFPTTLGNWHMVQEGVVEKETLDVLKADDTMFRIYQNDVLHVQGSVFIAYFQTQRQGQSPHSPKNCLPGSGWQPEENDIVTVPIGSEAISINHFVVSKGDDASIVYYWYQEQGTAIAGEFAAKVYLIFDSIKKHRSDAAMIRIIVPRSRTAEQLTTAAGLDLVRAAYPAAKAYLPQ